MQKLLQRTKQAERSVARRQTRYANQKDTDEGWIMRQALFRQRKMVQQLVKDEKTVRRENWLMGPLAPRRDIGESAKTYGTVHQTLVNPVTKTSKQRKGAVTWLSEGDRVVLLEGRDRGKITRISSVDEDSQTVRLHELNSADTYVPEYMRSEGNTDTEVAPYGMPVPWHILKLVHPIRDANGNFNDAIIDKVKVEKSSWYNIRHNDADKRGRRIIPGLNVEIPWPEIKEGEKIDHESDTHRITVDQVTFQPNLLSAPMPLSIIDELRYKYSAFRTRHDADYVAKKELESGDPSRKALLDKLVSMPMAELQERNRLAREAQIKDLTEDQLEAIGQAIEEEKAKAQSAVRASA